MAMIDDRNLRRTDPRSLVTPLEIKGLVTHEASKAHEPLLIWNISDGGICLWVTNRFSKGDKLKLTIAKPWVVMLACEVRWCKDYVDKPGYLLGVRVLDNLRRLEALHKHLAEDLAEGSAASA